MRTKLCVLGAVLGSASVMPVVCLPSEVATQQTKEEQPRGGVSRQVGQPFDGHEAENRSRRPLCPRARCATSRSTRASSSP
ncbi:hypothetical protein [Vitiosangium sp. GDMCC 1.1324]|uniref:hypothetical protein n=1 Tax=Vitiosangium sp. (strain GDMCC 1.1324) TaxID=2138576 RepID=UPI001E3FA9C8|nr:hypothetical protein [Vitiosangium sp. GDMCC 1.1324]